jgi:cysteinyl-tRNA synthetase
VGRPGWHIECSAMSMELLGESFDIHGGGKDLVFPHHENEIAQSEGASGKPFVRYWLHNGFVNINQEKMSKSLGNFFTIRDILAKYDPEVVRFFLLTAHYRSPIDFSDQNLEEARTGLTRFYEALQGAGDLLTAQSAPNPDQAAQIDPELRARIDGLESSFAEAMDDDFNTALAIGHFFDAVRAMNRLVAEGRSEQDSSARELLRTGRDTLVRLGEVLGLFASEPSDWLDKQKSAGLLDTGLTPDRIEELIAERLKARKEKNFARANAIRDELAQKGVILLDSKEGTGWKMK